MEQGVLDTFDVGEFLGSALLDFGLGMEGCFVLPADSHPCFVSSR